MKKKEKKESWGLVIHGVSVHRTDHPTHDSRSVDMES